MNNTELKELRVTAAKCRQKILRMCKAHKAGHLGGANSCIDIVTALYFHTMKVDPNNPELEDRDLFVLSAGHKCLAQYTALCQKGFFPEDLLDTYGCLNCRMPGHPDMKKLPGIEANTGALGHGLSIACGMALALRAKGLDSRVFTILGDGELAEGTAIVDNNGLQIGGDVTRIMDFSPIRAHFEGFGWVVREIDGHDMAQIVQILDALPFEKGRPSLIIAKTIKGKGFSKAENVGKYHFWLPTPEEMELAEQENAAELEALENE